MKRLLNRYLLLNLVFGLLFCANIHAQTEGTVVIKSTEKVKSIIAKKISYNKNVDEIDGFKIQLFYGGEQGAYKTRDEFESLFPEVDTQIKFDRPDWKVMVGRYKTQLEADRALVEIKEAFISAFVRSEKIKAIQEKE